MIDRYTARQVAKAVSNPGDASWNKIAHFAETGEVERGTGAAIREYPRIDGEPTRETLALAAEFVEAIEMEMIR